LVFNVLELEITDMLHIFWEVTSWRVEDIYCFRATHWLCACCRKISPTEKKFQYVGQEGREPGIE
jgi:hypothetical protein